MYTYVVAVSVAFLRVLAHPGYAGSKDRKTVVRPVGFLSPDALPVANQNIHWIFLSSTTKRLISEGPSNVF